MPLAPTAYYTSTLAPVHQALVAHRLVDQFLSGADVRFDGQDLASMYGFVLPSGEILSSIEFAHLLSIFNNSRVHMQAEKHYMGDEAPPGLYFTVVNGQLIQGPHKNRFGLYEEESGAAGLFLQGLHIDHYFLQNKAAPPALGSIAFALCAITAHLAGLDKISLLAAGGQGFSNKHIGFKVWPRLGFDAPLLPGEGTGEPKLDNANSVLDVVAIDQAWWDEHGSQRFMTFDLSPGSRSWGKLLPYVLQKLSAEQNS